MSNLFPEFTNHLRRFIKLDDDELKAVLSFMRPLSVKKKSFLLNEGQICRSNFFTEKGCLRMLFIDAKGVEQTTQFAIEHWWLADYMSFTNQSPAQFSIQAVEHSEVLALDYDLQEKLLAAVPQMEQYFRIVFQKAVAASQLRMMYTNDLSREDMYRFFVRSFPEFVQRIPQYMLASYLGFTPEYLSELRRKIA